MKDKETADLSAEELQKRIAELEAEIANHTIVNSLLAGDELEVALANKVFQQVGRIKELEAEVARLKQNIDYIPDDEKTDGQIELEKLFDPYEYGEDDRIAVIWNELEEGKKARKALQSP